MEEAAAVEALAGLAQTLRLRLFRALVVVGPEGLTPGSIAEALGLPASTLSFHLKGLTAAGLVNLERNGRHLIYRANFQRMNSLLGYLTRHCCAGRGVLVDDCDTACVSATGTSSVAPALAPAPVAGASSRASPSTRERTSP